MRIRELVKLGETIANLSALSGVPIPDFIDTLVKTSTITIDEAKEMRRYHQVKREKIDE